MSVDPNICSWEQQKWNETQAEEGKQRKENIKKVKRARNIHILKANLIGLKLLLQRALIPPKFQNFIFKHFPKKL